ncbi:MAG: PAS domain S-box protein, partial [Puniceicoccales bacterium]
MFSSKKNEFEIAYKREKQARKEAEQLLEKKSLELFEANEELRLKSLELAALVESRTEELEKQRSATMGTYADLVASERRYSDIAEVVGGYLWEMDKELRFVSVTNQVTEVLGYTSGEMVGRTFFEFIPQEDVPRLRAVFRNNLNRGYSFKNIRSRTCHKNGRIVWQMFGAAPIFDEKGRFSGVRGVGVEIPERGTSSSQLNLLYIALTHASEGFAVTDRSGRFTYMNPAHVEIYGYDSMDELIGHHWSVLYTKEVLDELEGSIERSLEETGTFHTATVGVRKDGSTFPEVCSLRLLPDGGILCICRDDTERQEFVDGLKAKNQLLSSLLENLTNGILFENRSERNTLTNDHLFELFPALRDCPDRRYRSVVDFLKLVRDEFVDGDPVLDEVERALEARKEIQNLECELSDGRFVAFDYVPVFVVEEFFGHLCLFRDITESKEQQNILEQARLEAVSGAEEKSLFLANMSHEVRTPLNGIVGMSRLLMGEDLTDKQMMYLRSIRASADSLMQVITDILDYSKLEAGKMGLEPVDFSPIAMIDSVASVFLLRHVHSENVRFYVNYEPALPALIRGDDGRVKEILQNLLSNSFKFTNKGFVSLDVKLDRFEHGMYWINFVVEDTGVGISKEAAETIFEPFTQADNSVSRSYGGTGLGLSICRNFVSLMKGEFSMESEPGQGSFFKVSLPFPPADSPTKDPVTEIGGETLLVGVVASDERLEKSIVSMIAVNGVSVSVSSDLPGMFEMIRREKGEGPLVGVIAGWSFTSESTNEIELLLEEVPELRFIFIGTEGELPHQFTEKIVRLDLPTSRDILMNAIFRTSEYYPSDHYLDDPLAETGGGAVLQGRSFLLAEDNRINQKVTQATLEQLGATVDIAANGFEAVSMNQQFSYDLIFMDVHMPEMDGIEATRTIRSSGSKIPIVALTADAKPGSRELFMQAGMNAFLSKPLMVNDLIEALKATIGITRVPVAKPTLPDSDSDEKPEEEREAPEEYPDEHFLDISGLAAVIGGDFEAA